ncbi:hypothetical protein GCM10022224_035650 [Nonomuraea antimicrobica]|uniref:Uncharacterized protein n=1 Tax=Nonomuraea antimicrobica TaxID=561173 RepID=A0ABP7BTY1_9ACTN
MQEVHSSSAESCSHGAGEFPDERHGLGENVRGRVKEICVVLDSDRSGMRRSIAAASFSAAFNVWRSRRRLTVGTPSSLITR